MTSPLQGGDRRFESGRAHSFSLLGVLLVLGVRWGKMSWLFGTETTSKIFCFENIEPAQDIWVWKL